ncbi:hypothetical protein [Cesiribacter andamanensis]|uniref:Uncharacterized protein n=1 Tax=Cesiribacter andamanensis AMV16 TaxID=1279009 RepID=M7N7Y3_9BACT|nr:hypothetical protein [Cesiribacter andamanensis]EMR03357.1 hypothetical protein ADICEAN_01535 [Cesiribacter andamanensis AMV16]
MGHVLGHETQQVLHPGLKLCLHHYRKANAFRPGFNIGHLQCVNAPLQLQPL